MKYIAVLLTVHNRKEKTLACLSCLYKQEMPDGYSIDVYLTDDGCTDGTPEGVRELFPDVHIIKGDGNLYWNRGMYVAWEEAAKVKDYDYYLWLNDDTNLMPHCIKSLLESSIECTNKAIIVASIRSEYEDRVTYGGLSVLDGMLVVPNGQLQECVTMNGNCVLIPCGIYTIVGNLKWIYHHAIGDFDYGSRTRKAGFKIYASKEYLGYCENNSKPPIWVRPEVPIVKRIKNLYSPLGNAQPIPFFYYEYTNIGCGTAIKHFLTAHIRVLFPWLWKKH